ncbi:MAG: hypothetical protein ACK2UH_09005, partial [Candidatus Promineifilaceae bacterium]
MHPILRNRKLTLSFILGVALLVVLLGRSAASSGPVQARRLDYVRRFDGQEAGVNKPVGLAYSPLANSLFTLEASAAETPGNREIVMINRQRESFAGLASAATKIAAPAAMAFDPWTNSLANYDDLIDQLV